MADLFTRLVAYALRHNPSQYGLSLDEEGFVSLPRLYSELKAQHPEIVPSAHSGFEAQLAASEHDRFQIIDGMIRASYGHSLVSIHPGVPRLPPPLLYHATRALHLPSIQQKGLVPVRRLLVHMTSDWIYAMNVRSSHEKKGGRGIILRIDAQGAHAGGLQFFQASKSVWQTAHIPGQFLSLASPEQKNAIDRSEGTSRLSDQADRLRARLAEAFPPEE